MNLLHYYYEQQQELNSLMVKRTLTAEDWLTAMAAEVGEFLQEIKADWCWWREVPPPDAAKALEEGVDVLFFALSLDLHQGTLGEYEPPEPQSKSYRTARYLMLTALQLAAAKALQGYTAPLAPVVLSALYASWPREEVLRAYNSKLEVNRRRVSV